MFDLKQDGNLFVVTLQGKVTAEEVTAFYEKFTPALESAGKVGVVIDMAGFDDMSAEAVRRDIPLELGLIDQMGKIPRAALVTDKEFVGAMVDAFNPLVPMIDIRVFGTQDRDAAHAFAADLPDKAPKGTGAHLIETADPGILAFEIDGYIDEAGMDAIANEVNARIECGERLRILGRIRSFGGFDPGILTKGSFFRMKFGSISALERYAVVSDEGWLKPLIGFARTVTGTEIRHFPLSQEPAAMDWLRA